MKSKSPYNPLDEFQSYSVHYVLLACRTTEVAKRFAADDAQVKLSSLQAIESAKYLGSAIPFDGAANDIFLVIDTRRFSQFTVETLKYDVFVNGLDTGATVSNLATDLTMTVLDSTGISFANFMQWLLDKKMETNYDGVVFMLRVVFVGHKPDGSTETVQSETIPMHLFRMEINLDYAKGAYTLDFLPNMNFDVKRHSRLLTVSTATSYNTYKGNKLGGLITNFEKTLNDASTKYFNDVQAVIKNSTGRADGFGRKVQYMITIPGEWNEYIVNGVAAGDQLERKWTENKDGKVLDTYTGTSTGTSIPAVLDYFFRQVPEIAAMGNFRTDQIVDGMITFYKHIVGITSDNDIMMVHVDVVEFKVPNLFNESKNPNSSNQVSKQEKDFYVNTVSESGQTIRSPKDYLEWDYIFTGLNKDILNFDLKIEDFQFLLASNLRYGDGALKASSDEDGKVSQKDAQNNDDLLYARKYDPLIMPQDSAKALSNFSALKIPDPEKSKQIVSEQLQYTKNLSMFYAGSPIVTVMTIKGNPLIMHKFNIGELLMHPKASDQASGTAARASYRQDLENRVLKALGDGSSSTSSGSFVLNKTSLSPKSYATSPVFAKVNIKGPKVDFKTNEPLDGDYSQSVLSDNYYVIFKVTNNFAGHMFTQELELYVHNVFGRGKITKQE